MNEGREVVLVGHDERRIGRIYPLHRQFERLAAADGAHRGARRERALRLNARRREQGELRARFEKVEVHGHSPRTDSLSSYDSGLRSLNGAHKKR